MQLPLYIMAQLLGSILASGTLCLCFTVHPDDFFGTVPVGSYVQSLVIEIIASFLLMFVISGVATDNRAVSNYLFNYLKLAVLRSCHYIIKDSNSELKNADWPNGRNCYRNDHISRCLRLRVFTYVLALLVKTSTIYQFRKL